MLDKLDEWGPITVLILIAATIVLGGGIVVVIVNPETLTFQQYLDSVSKLVIGGGALGVGRGIMAGLTNLGIAVHLPAADPSARVADHLDDEGTRVTGAGAAQVSAGDMPQRVDPPAGG